MIGSWVQHWGRHTPGLIAAALCVVNIAFAWNYLVEVRQPGAEGGKKAVTRSREAVWRELLLAEADLREGQGETELLREDFDADGQLEISAAHPSLTLLVAPHQGGW